MNELIKSSVLGTVFLLILIFSAPLMNDDSGKSEKVAQAEQFELVKEKRTPF